MKKIFLFLVIFALSFGAKAQTWTPIFGKQRFASGLGIPTKDSTYFAGAADSSLIYINPKDAGLYYKYKGYHKKVGTGTVSSIALTMPSAFSVSGSPITNNGSFVVTGAGSITQYIRGDGSLATFAGAPGTLPVGGTSGQILAKIDGTNYNTEWIDNYSTQIKNIVKLGAALSKGTPVYVSSANGTNIIVSASSYDTEATSSKTFGLLETGGALNDQVKVVTYGLLAGLNTGTAAAGDPVWLGANGALIYGYANKPHAPYHMVFIGIVTRAQSVNGEIFVNVQNGFELDELHNVAAQTPSNNDGLFYESSTSLWKNKSIATVLGYTPEQPLTFSAPLSRSVNTVSIPAATGSVNGYLSSTDWTTFNSKQAQINGTGFVKASGTTISYDNSTYLTTTSAASTYVPYTGATSAVNIGNNVLTSGYSILNGSGLTNEAGVLSLLKGTSRAVQGNGYTNLYAESGKVGFIDWITGNVRTFELSLASLTAGTTRVYTLPDASGTMALTSDLSSYVPYSGATGAVNLGAYDLTVNGLKVGKGGGNIANNTAVGSLALNANTTGTGNTAFGNLSLFSNTTGGSNSSFGGFALLYNTTGASNAAFGGAALQANTTGNGNTAIGINTLQNNTTGGGNTATGVQSLKANTTGIYNTASGANALGSNTTANYNTAIGNNSFLNNTTGENNTGIGNNSGVNITTGSNNTIVGAYAGTSTMSSNVILSDGAGNIRFQYNGTNTILGQSGNVGIGTPSPSYGLDIQSASSTGAYLNITKTGYASAFLQPYNDGVYFGSYNAYDLIFSTNNSPKMRLTNNGGLNLGTVTGNTITKLNVQADATRFIAFEAIAAGGNKSIYIRPVDTGIHMISSNYISGSPYLPLALSARENNADLYLATSGNIGIGTISPSWMLEVNKDTPFAGFGQYPAVSVNNPNASGYSAYYFFSGATNKGGFEYNNSTNNLLISGNGAERMRITNNGRFGLNSSNPNRHYVFSNPDNKGAGGFEINSTDNLVTFLSYNRSTNAYMPISLSEGTTNVLVGTTSDNGNKLRVNGDAWLDGSLRVNGSFAALLSRDATNSTAYGFANSGNGLLTLTNSGVANVGYFTMATGVYVSVSDRNKKKDFEQSTIGLNEVMQLKPTLYRMKTESEDSEKQLGFIAQEVKGIIPSAYQQSGDFIGLNFNPIVAALTKAVQELNQKITNLEAQIKQ